MSLAVGFDFDHTLGIDNKLERVAFLRLLSYMPAQELTLAEETQRIDELLKVQRSGAFCIDEAVARFAQAHGVHEDPTPLVTAFKRFALESVEQFVVPLPGVGELLKNLQSAGIPHAILSNGWNPLQDRKAAQVHFSGPVLVSAGIGARKPSAQAFSALLETLGSAASRTWYVGDDPAIDVAGSIAAGLNGVWIDADGAGYPSDLPRPCATIHDLRELPEVLLSGPGANARA